MEALYQAEEWKLMLCITLWHETAHGKGVAGIHEIMVIY